MTTLPTDSPVGVIGAGAMGAGIAQVAAEAGHPVRLYDVAAGAAEAGRARIADGLAKLVLRGKRAQEEVEATMARIGVADDLNAMAGTALVVEAIAERLEVKQSVFSALEEVVAPGGILATNTSSISVTAIAAALKHPGRMAGMHFFNPVPVMKLVEIVTGLATEPKVTQCLLNTAAAWGKVAVRVASTPGFIVNRVARPFYAEALRFVEEQRSDPGTLDAIMTEGGGFRMGPMALMDLIGHDVNAAVTRNVFDATFQDPRYRPSHLQDELVAAGWLGRKTGRGLFCYDGDLPADTVRTETRTDSAPIEGLTLQAPLVLESCVVLPSDGRSAAAVAAEAGKPAVVHDLVPPGVPCTRLAFSLSEGVDEQAVARFVATLDARGMTASRVGDGPGLPVIRTLAMLASEAFDLVLHGTASAADIDQAMRFGVNYPKGPIAWADEIGPGRLLGVLDRLLAATGDPRYRASYGLRRAAGKG